MVIFSFLNLGITKMLAHTDAFFSLYSSYTTDISFRSVSAVTTSSTPPLPASATGKIR